MSTTTHWTLCSKCTFPIPKGVDIKKCKTYIELQNGLVVKCACGHLRNSEIEKNNCIMCIMLKRPGCVARTSRQKEIVKGMTICAGVCKRPLTAEQAKKHCIYCEAIETKTNDDMVHEKTAEKLCDRKSIISQLLEQQLIYV